MFLYKCWTESLFTSLQISDEPNKCDLFWYFSRFALPFNKIGCTSEIKNKCDLFWYFSRFALPFNKIGCTREYKTKLRICFDIPLICTTFAERLFITVCILRRLSSYNSVNGGEEEQIQACQKGIILNDDMETDLPFFGGNLATWQPFFIKPSRAGRKEIIIIINIINMIKSYRNYLPSCQVAIRKYHR